MIGAAPAEILSTDIDESERPGELARDVAQRLAAEKAEAGARMRPGALVLAADTVVSVGRRILPKAEDQATARRCLDLLSGRAHRVHTGVALAGPGAERRLRVCETRVKVRRLGADDVESYIASDEWRGKAGGYAIQGRFAMHVVSIVGSHSNIVGLPLYETAQLLRGVGCLA